MPILDSKAAGMVADLSDHLGTREPTPEEMTAFEAKLGTEPRHCEDYLDDPTQPECLRRFLDYQCRPAALKWPTGRPDFDRGLEERLGMPMWRDPVPVLFAVHEGKPVRVTMASRFGDVGITEDLSAEHSYGKRVAVEELTDFSDVTPIIIVGVDCSQGSEDPARPKVRVQVGWIGRTFTNGEAIRLNGETNVDRVAAPSHSGNRAQRRAAAARARR
jgi:hypothetical protein